MYTTTQQVGKFMTGGEKPKMKQSYDPKYFRRSAK